MGLLVLLLGFGALGVWMLASRGSEPDADSVDPIDDVEVRARAEPEPIEPIEPIEFDAPPPPDPTPAPAEVAVDEPPPSAQAPPKKAKKKPAVRRSKLYLALGFIEAMEVSIGGIRRTLRTSGPHRATIAIKPGRKTVRWGGPGESRPHSKRVTIEEGKDYQVMLDGRGVTIEAKRSKAP